MKSGLLGGVLGSLMGVLLGAAAFRGGAPVDARFTFQGQIRDGDVLINGTADIRFSLWDAAEGGAMVGSTLTRSNLPITDGRFATELDFGSAAFAGDARWVQMEVRSPAGAGQYAVLTPRQRVNAVPYALYSLNGGLSPWNLDVSTRDIGYVNGRVGIGTNAPSAALEVVSSSIGDESVKLPSRSVGVNELDAGALAQSSSWSGQYAWTVGSPAGWADVVSANFTIDSPAVVALTASYRGPMEAPVVLLIDGREVARLPAYASYTPGSPLLATVALSPGTHSIVLRYDFFFPACPNGNCGGFFAWGSILAVRTSGAIQ